MECFLAGVTLCSERSVWMPFHGSLVVKILECCSHIEGSMSPRPWRGTIEDTTYSGTYNVISYIYPVVEALPRRRYSTAVTSPSRSLQHHIVSNQQYPLFVLHEIAISQHIFIIITYGAQHTSCCEDPKFIIAAPLQKGQALQVVIFLPTQRPARLEKVENILPKKIIVHLSRKS